MKHTEGEWVNGWGNGLTGPTTPRAGSPTVDNDRKFIPISIGRETIAIVIEQINNSKEELEANAKLIAGAPDLLKKLKECQNIIEIMLENNIGRGTLLGKVYLSGVFDRNKSTIEKATT